jgi:excisionase family DNA binding protein
MTHIGVPIVRPGPRPGQATILCPAGHLIQTVEVWAGSAWEAKATEPVSCDGQTPAGLTTMNARAYGSSVTLKEAAERLGLSPATLRVQIRNRKLRARKVGRDWHVTSAEIDRYRRVSQARMT